MSVRTFHVETLGCKVNQYDSQRLAEGLEAVGFRRAPDGCAPDLYVVNTCTVTRTSDRKCRQAVRRAVRDNPGARVFVTGCYATAAPARLRDVEGVAGVFGRGEWRAMLEAAARRPPAGSAVPEGDFGVTGFSGRTRALLKIQDGCGFFCSYCIVPFVRGEPRSRPLHDVLEEARRLLDRGFREIVLTGIHLGLYGRDLDDGVELADVVARVAELPGVGRVRLSSLEAPEVSRALLDAMAHPAVCPHLHLPLQSGDDGVLARMGRRYTACEFLETVARARERLDQPGMTGDVIVGFPGETEEQFRNTLLVCRQAAFSRLHIFPFSPRPGTRAAEMDGRLPPGVVRQRSARLGVLARDLAADWSSGFQGRTVRVLFEEAAAEGTLAGYTDRYVRLMARGPAELLGTLQHVRCAAAQAGKLTGELIDGSCSPLGHVT